MTGILSSVLLKPLVNPGAYMKHWGAIGTGVAGIGAQAYGEQLGLSAEQVQGFIAVLTAVVVNMLANRA